jgi:hypothetical protein
MKKILAAIVGLFALTTAAFADNTLIVDTGYGGVATNVQNRLQASGHTVTITNTAPTDLTGYQQVWDLRYATALTTSETTLYQTFITNGGFAYFVTENPGCCMDRNNSVAALVTSLGGGSTQIGPGWAGNVNSDMNTTYMTNGITVNYAAVAAIVNSQGIPLISDSSGNVSGMSWIGRAGALSSGVTGTIVTVADINWLDNQRMVIGSGASTAQQQNVQALDDIINGIVAGTVGGTISSSGNGSAATNGNSGTPPTPPPPTVVSTIAGPNNITSTTTYGNATTTNVVVDSRTNQNKKITITRTTTPVTVTPFTNNVVTTPTTVTTYSDGSTTTSNGDPVTSSTTGNVTNIGVSNVETAQVSAVGLSEATKFKSFNPFLVDALSSKDGGWITPSASYYKSAGSSKTGGIDLGFHKTIENNSFGVALRMDGSASGEYLNSKADSTSYTGTVYALTKQNYGWWKVAVGVNRNDYSSTVSIPQFGLINGTKMNQTNYYADIGAYAPSTIMGIRPLAGIVINNSVIGDVRETGSPLLSTAPNTGSTVTTNPYFGGRYEFNKSVYFESKLMYDKEYKVVSNNRLGVKTDIYKNMSLELGAGFDKGSDYTGYVGTAGVKWKF